MKKFLTLVSSILIVSLVYGASYFKGSSLYLDDKQVIATAPSTNQYLKYNGTAWVPETISAVTSGSAGQSYFLDDTVISATSSQNAIPIKSLSKTPIVISEDIDTISGVTSAADVPYGFYLDGALNRTTIDGGVWTANIYASASSTVGTIELLLNAMRVRLGTGTITITGSGTSRTVTASTGTPFASTDISASSVISDASFVSTPQGIFQITGRTSDTVVTISTLSTYTNESAVAYKVHKKLFQLTTGDIPDVYPNFGLHRLSVTLGSQAVLATDALECFVLGKNSSATPRTVYFAHGGADRYSYLTAPLSTYHNELGGLSGTTPFYHSNQAIDTTSNVSFASATIPTLNGNMSLPGTTTVGNFTDSSAHLILRGGSGGAPLISLQRTSGVTSQFDWSLSGGGLTFSDRTNGALPAFISGSSSINQFYIGERSASAYTGRNSLLAAESLSATSAANSNATNLTIRSGLGLGTGTAGYTSFETGTTQASGTTAHVATERMRITGAGNVGIGTTNPATELSVSGTITSTNITSKVNGYTWPASDGSTGQFLKTDGNKVLSFGSATGGSGLTFSSATTALVSVASGTHYLANSSNGSPQKFQTPASASLGDYFGITGAGTDGWQLWTSTSASTLVNIGSAYSQTSVPSASTQVAQSLGTKDSVSLVCTKSAFPQTWTAYSQIGSEVTANWWGTGADGSLSTTGDVTLSSASTGAVVKQYQDLTINTGNTLTVSNPTRGLILYVRGNLTVNGTISMTGKGCDNCDPTALGVASHGIIIRRAATGGSSSSASTSVFAGMGATAEMVEANQPSVTNGFVLIIPKAGAAGGAAKTSGNVAGNAGTSGASLLSAGGGGGGARYGGGLKRSGAGAYGSLWSGGSGGGALADNGVLDAGDAASYGGQGGYASGSCNGGSNGGGGGAGNPPGAGCGASSYNGGTGTGGLLIIFVKGNVSIGASGVIAADGMAGGAGNAAGGGGSGGGVAGIIYGGTYVNSGTLRANGGAGGVGNGGAENGGAGGAGYTFYQKVDPN